MSNRTPYLFELGLGLALTGVIAWAYHTRAPIPESINLKTYDLLSQHRPHKPPSSDIRIVAIDDNAVSRLGRWPWPRALQSQLVDEIAAAGAKVIGLNVVYADPDQSQGFDELKELERSYDDLLKKSLPVMKKKGVKAADFQKFKDDMAATAEALNGDALMANSLHEAGKVVLPMYFEPGQPLGNNLDALPTFFDKEHVMFKDTAHLGRALVAQAAILPLESFGTAVLAIGHCNLSPDVDGILRRVSPVVQYGNVYFPSFGLQVVREFLNLERKTFSYQPGQGFVLQKAVLPIEESAMTYVDFSGPAGTFAHYSALDVLSDGLPEGSLTKKIVLVGVTATGNGEVFTGPRGERYTGLEIWANHIGNILNQSFINRPSWAPIFEWIAIALAGLVVIVALPLMKARFSIPITLVVFALLLGASGYLFVTKGVWASPTYGLMLLTGGFAVLVGKRLLFTEHGKEIVEAEGMETNKMLGLSFQGQGMLDLAFEKFRKCPVDNAMKDLLYNLGLDMERKRMFAKAAAVYEHIGTADPKYKDIPQKIEMLKKASEGAVFGGLGKKGTDATVVVDGLGQNTTLGRYEITKELGRGAMGIVYLGRDPKINRQVAVKTLRFEDTADEEQTKSIKERFFREAESAGNLTHPNIIRIFDAGEDQEVAYIAMELLDGQDLKQYCEKANLLPPTRTIEIMIQIADALDYAHKQGVVHRDIKPGNIMMLRDGTLRITDFGIARIQATSKTATGAVLGTPAYMSPEQVNGKKVDGRADIFSLGVTLYEMLTGEKPFQADSIAALLYRIANVDHTDPRDYNPKIPQPVVTILNKALSKDPANRYQTGSEMARDLRAVLQALEHTDATSTANVQIPTAPPPLKLDSPLKKSPPVEAAQTEPPKLEKTVSLDEAKGPDFLSDLEQAFSMAPPHQAPPIPETKTFDSTMVDEQTHPVIDEAIPPIDGLEQNNQSQKDSSL